MGDFKPADLYVGIVELFGVLLPGVLLTGALVVTITPWIGDDPQLFSGLLDGEAARWVAFVLAAYTLGAFVFSIASPMDHAWYDPYRRRKWPREKDHAYQLATDLRRRFFRRRGLAAEAVATAAAARARFSWAESLLIGLAAGLGGKAGAAETGADDNPMNTFAWAKALLILHAPGAYGDVQRYEAESKFFRSLVIVLPLAGLLGLIHWCGEHPVMALASPLFSVPLAWLSFARYAERRHKSTEWAYRYVVTLQLGPKPPPSEPPGDRAREP